MTDTTPLRDQREASLDAFEKKAARGLVSGDIDSAHDQYELALESFASVCARTSLSRVTVWRKIRDPESTFPVPIKICGGRVGFYRHEVDQWLESRPRVDYAPKASAA